MSETEISVPMDDKALFAGAISDAPETAQETQTEQTAPARDESGRFAAKAEKTEQVEAQAETQTEQTQQTEAAQVPSWRLAEVSEARRAAEARAAENERRAQELERHIHQLSGQLRQFTEKPQEPVDFYSDPEKFADQRASQAVDPVKGEVANIREYYSRKDAVRTHGEETVVEAYKWLDQAARSRDPNAVNLVQRVRNSLDPFEEIVTAFKRDKALSTVGNDPNAWFEKELERRKADPEFLAKLGVQQTQQTQTPSSVVKLPPSLNRQPGSAGNQQSGGSLSDKDLYAYATS